MIIIITTAIIIAIIREMTRTETTSRKAGIGSQQNHGGSRAERRAGYGLDEKRERLDLKRADASGTGPELVGQHRVVRQLTGWSDTRRRMKRGRRPSGQRAEKEANVKRRSGKPGWSR